jgi:hypothetical protein
MSIRPWHCLRVIRYLLYPNDADATCLSVSYFVDLSPPFLALCILFSKSLQFVFSPAFTEIGSKMQLKSIIAAVLFAHEASAQAMMRFGCASLVVERLDPLVNPGVNPSPHVHQVGLMTSK